MLIPSVTRAAGAGEFDEAHAALDQSPREEALRAECIRLGKGSIEAVELLRRLRFGARDPSARGLWPACDRPAHSWRWRFRERRGFPKRETTPWSSFRISRQLMVLQIAARFRGSDVGDGVRAGLEDRALKGGGEETAVEVIEAAGVGISPPLSTMKPGDRRSRCRGTVSSPGAHAGTALESAAGVQKNNCACVLGDSLVMERMMARSSTHSAHVGKQLADRRARIGRIA